MELPSFFKDFITSIRLTDEQLKDLKNSHEELRALLGADDTLSSIVISTFLQGSYRRSTAIRPISGLADVDVVVVTNIDKDKVSPQRTINYFIPFLDKHYNGRYEKQSRSIAIKFQGVKLDLVPTSAPSETDNVLYKSDFVTRSDSIDEIVKYNEDDDVLMKSDSGWKLSPLFIPDKDSDTWHETNPIAQIRWTIDKNKKCNGFYLDIVKAIKWWRCEKHPLPKYPKSYPLEHLIGQMCPDHTNSVAEGLTSVFENIVTRYKLEAERRQVPILLDHGVSQNVFARISPDDFVQFYEHISVAAKIARNALENKNTNESVKLWREFLGESFPDSNDDEGNTSGGYSNRKNNTTIKTTRFAL